MVSDRAMALLRAMEANQESSEGMVYGPKAARVLSLDVDTDEHYFSEQDQRLYIELCRELERAGYIQKADPPEASERLEEYVAIRLTETGLQAALG